MRGGGPNIKVNVFFMALGCFGSDTRYEGPDDWPTLHRGWRLLALNGLLKISDKIRVQAFDKTVDANDAGEVAGIMSKAGPRGSKLNHVVTDSATIKYLYNVVRSFDPVMAPGGEFLLHAWLGSVSQPRFHAGNWQRGVEARASCYYVNLYKQFSNLHYTELRSEQRGGQAEGRGGGAPLWGHECISDGLYANEYIHARKQG